jgi:hypothetical protein
MITVSDDVEGPGFELGAASPEACTLFQLTVLIPALDEERNIGRLVEFLRVHARHPSRRTELTIWVDASGSTDRTVEIVEKIAADWSFLHVVSNGKRDGLLQALNRLLEHVAGELTLRLDADVRLEPDTITHLVATLEAASAGIVSPRVAAARSPSRWADAMVQAEYELHHFVSVREPKTTLVQLFRSVPVRLRPDAGIEDGELQEQVASTAGPAAYDPAVTITVVPPATVRQFLWQRVRTIRHTAHHRGRGYPRPSTASPRIVFGAVIDTLHAGTIPAIDTLLFLSVEVYARLAAPVINLLRPTPLFDWEPLTDTKQPTWGGMAESTPDPPPKAIPTE